MATYKVKGPDGTTHLFRGPDGATPDQVIAQAKKQFAQPTETPETPEETPEPEQKTSQALGFFEGFHKPMDNAAVWAEGGLKRLGVPTDRINRFFGTPSAVEARDQNRASVAAEEEKGTKPGFWGKLGGSVVGTAPALIATRNPAIAGGIAGAMESNGDTVGDVAKSAGWGAVGGKLGDVATRSVGAVVAPVLRPAVNRMLNRGVRLTPGQIMGGGLHRMEDASTSIPFAGDVVKGAQNRGLDDFNKSLVNDALSPIGQKLPGGIEAGHASVKHAQVVLGKAYDQVLPQITVHPPAVGSQAHADFSNLMRLVRNMPPKHQHMFDRILNDEIIDKMRVNTPGGGFRSVPMSGHTLKDTEEILNKEIQDFTHSPNPHDRRYGEAMLELQTQLREWAANSSPHVAKQLRAINAGYANLTRIETAAADTREGVFTPDQFRAATRRGDKSVRGRISAAGEARMQDIAKDGTGTLARTLGESGTAPRWAINSAVGLALGGGTAIGAINPLIAGALGGTLGLYTRAGGAAFRAAVRRPQGFQAVRHVIDSAAPAAALAGASAINNKHRNVTHTEED